jgi:hypothetical protein
LRRAVCTATGADARETREVGELKPERIAVKLTERQLRIAERLDGLSSTLGDLFRAGVRGLRERGDEAWMRLAAHACREIVNRVPDYLDLPVAGKRLDYPQRFREIADRWPEDLAAAPADDVLALVARLVEEHRAVSATLRERAEALFQAVGCRYSVSCSGGEFVLVDESTEEVASLYRRD